MKVKSILIIILTIVSSCSRNEEIIIDEESNLDSRTIVMSSNNSNNSIANNCSDTHTDEINNNISLLYNAGGGTLILDNGLHLINKQILLKSNVNLQINGTLEKVDCISNFYLIKIQNVENVRIHGNNISKIKTITSHVDNSIYVGNSNNIDLLQFSLDGDTNDFSATGIKIFNSSNINVKNTNISNFKNKGVSITGSNQNNIVVSENNITGSNSSTGAGISISDSGGKIEYSEIASNYIDSCRIGITINKSRYINILNNHCINNSLTGIALDGIDSESGDGAQSCIISGNFLIGNGYNGTNCSSQEFAGIYLGNGADKNIISENIIRENAFGISYNDINLNSTNGSYNNSITNNQIIENRWRGIKLSNMHRAILSDNEIIQNLMGGIEFKNVDVGNYLINNNNLVLNGDYGMIFTSCTNVNEILLNSNNIVTAHNTQEFYQTISSPSCVD